MKGILCLVCCALLFAGCGKNQKKDAEEKKPAAETAAVSNADLAKGFLDAIVPVSVAAISPEQKNLPEFAGAMGVVEALTQLESMTGLKFYGSSTFLDTLSPEAKAALTAKSTKMIPFFVEDARSGQIVFAPADAQQQIIRAWQRAFPRITKRLDAAPLSESAPVDPAAQEAPAAAKDAKAAEPAKPAADPAQDIMF